MQRKDATGKMTLGLTFDIDWVPEEVLSDTIELIGKYGNVNATFFATHDSEVLKKTGFEIGIHPNFNKLLLGEDDRNFKEIIDSLLAIYPKSKGFRAHSLTNSSIIFDYITSKGMTYESNCLLPYSKKLDLTSYPSGLIRVPFNFEDDSHFACGHPFSLEVLRLGESDLHIFNFHPVHVFLNTAMPEHYSSAKQFYQQPNQLIKFRNSKMKGSRDLLVSILDFAASSNLRIHSLQEIIQENSVSALE